ncbi:MAG: hypothetical protein ABIZ56_09630, partial [Chthoniobacteraceae bacterium]
YSFDLKTALLAVGLLLIAGHAFALLRPKVTRDFLQKLPRSRAIGFVLLVIVAVWAWLLAANIDLGEFSDWRPKLKIFIPIVTVLTWFYVEEFLAARCLGMLVLLAAEPLLESAFLRPEMSRLFLVTLVYVWVSFALFWIGMPYTLRDQISWVSKTDGRWKAAAFAGIGYGAILLFTIGTLGRAA